MTTSLYFLPSEAHRGLLAPGPCGERPAIRARRTTPCDCGHARYGYPGGHHSSCAAWTDTLVLALVHDGRPCPLALSRLRDAVARACGASEEEIAEGVNFYEVGPHAGALGWALTVMRKCRVRVAGNEWAWTGHREVVCLRGWDEVKGVPVLPPVLRTAWALARVAEHLGLGTVVEAP